MSELNELHKEVCSISRQWQESFDKPKWDRDTIFCPRLKEKSIFILNIRTSGCSWYNSGLGCFKEKIGVEDIIRQFKILERDFSLKGYETFFAYSSCFFDNNEIPLAARKYLYEMVNRHKNLKNIYFQTRPELVNSENLDEIRKYLPDKNIILRLGVETSNDFIRRYCINKSFSFNFVKKKAKLITDSGLQPSAFLLIKPPFITEKEAIDDALKSVKDCLNIGIKDLLLMPVGVYKASLVGLLYQLEMYKPIWIWSLLHILNNIDQKGMSRIIISDLGSMKSLITKPKNCPQCTEEIYKLMEGYDLNKDSAIIFDKVKCKCKLKWEEIISQTSIPLKKRLVMQYKQLIANYND
jgi:radical SAM enzyme (TIGR01210 family)